MGESYPSGTNESFSLLGNIEYLSDGWKYLGTLPGDICDVDFDSLNVESIRYLCIVDGSPQNATNTYVSPGADIDAVEVLNYEPLGMKGEKKSNIEILYYKKNSGMFNTGCNVYYIDHNWHKGNIDQQKKGAKIV